MWLSYHEVCFSSGEYRHRDERGRGAWWTRTSVKGQVTTIRTSDQSRDCFPSSTQSAVQEYTAPGSELRFFSRRSGGSHGISRQCLPRSVLHRTQHHYTSTCCSFKNTKKTEKNTFSPAPETPKHAPFVENLGRGGRPQLFSNPVPFSTTTSRVGAGIWTLVRRYPKTSWRGWKSGGILETTLASRRRGTRGRGGGGGRRMRERGGCGGRYIPGGSFGGIRGQHAVQR